MPDYGFHSELTLASLQFGLAVGWHFIRAPYEKHECHIEIVVVQASVDILDWSFDLAEDFIQLSEA